MIIAYAKKTLILVLERILETTLSHFILKLNKETQKASDLPKDTQLVNGKDRNHFAMPTSCLLFYTISTFSITHRKEAHSMCQICRRLQMIPGYYKPYLSWYTGFVFS